MKGLILNEQQVTQLIQENKYEIDSKKRFISRCIDGRYQNDEDLPALAIPGADAGQMAVIFAAANITGLEIDREKAYTAFLKAIGGKKSIRVHTDDHNPSPDEVVMAGCGYKNHLETDPEGFNVHWEDVAFIKEKIRDAKEAGGQEVVLKGQHLEGAVLLVRGNWGIKPRYEIERDSENNLTQVFVFHQSLVDERHRAIVEKLLDAGAIATLGEDDQEYLFTIISEASEAHFFEIAGRLAKGLPIFEVSFKDDGTFDLKNLGQVD